MFFLENWAFTTAATNGFYRYYAPTFSQLPNAAEYVALFDMYRINGVKLTFRPRFGGYDAGTVAAPQMNAMYISTFIDSQAITAPTGVYSSATYNTFLENANGRVKTRMATRPYDVYWKPMVQNDLTGLAGGFRRTPWLRSDTGGALQRGVFVFVNDVNFSNASTFSMDVFVTFYLQVKGNK